VYTVGDVARYLPLP
jgi:hypothetical protein